MTNFFLRFLERIGRKRIIMDRDGKSPYLVRYYIFLKEREKFPFNVFLHNFLRSDPDDLHDHPWPWATLILKGGYWEWIPVFREEIEDAFAGVNTSTENIIGERKVWRGAWTFRSNIAESYHRIELEPGVDCWTLFMTGKRIREWGFLTHKNWLSSTFKWIRFDRYIDKRSNHTME